VTPSLRREVFQEAILLYIVTYKQAGDHLAIAHRAYRQTRHNYGRLANMTAEEHIHLADLAISWGEATVMYANTKFS
jgi:hypothetical protein